MSPRSPARMRRNPARRPPPNRGEGDFPEQPHFGTSRQIIVLLLFCILYIHVFLYLHDSGKTMPPARYDSGPFQGGARLRAQNASDGSRLRAQYQESDPLHDRACFRTARPPVAAYSLGVGSVAGPNGAWAARYVDPLSLQKPGSLILVSTLLAGNGPVSGSPNRQQRKASGVQGAAMSPRSPARMRRNPARRPPPNRGERDLPEQPHFGTSRQIIRP